jgi:hypothetical protein
VVTAAPSAVGVARPAHDHLALITPFYAGWAPGGAPATEGPALHRFDTASFVPRFVAEVAAAAAQPAAKKCPPSLLDAVALAPDPAVPDFDVDALDFAGGRFRKLYQPAHFRFYLAACELICRVPGVPAPARRKVKKVEMVIRRVPVRRREDALPEVGTAEWAWAPVPEPEAFPDTSPDVTRELAPRLTGNTHTWWPVPQGASTLESERRFPMSRTPGAALGERAVYFGFLPLASGEMYGPRSTIAVAKGAGEGDDHDFSKDLPDPGGGPAPVADAAVAHVRPLVPAPSNFPLSRASMAGWRQDWQALLGKFRGGKATEAPAPMTVPRPKFEAPALSGTPDGAWAYVVRCVATVEPKPGCLVEVWGPPTAPMLMAPFFDPFGGRPTQIDFPSIEDLKSLLGKLAQGDNVARQALAKRGGFPLALKTAGTMPTVDTSDVPGGAKGIEFFEICFFALPLITICARIMISIAMALLFAFQFLLKLKFCLPIPKPK